MRFVLLEGTSPPITNKVAIYCNLWSKPLRHIDDRVVGVTRALLTETERRRIAGEDDVAEQRVYESVSRVRRRISSELPRDVEVLAENHPELLEELRAVVCDE